MQRHLLAFYQVAKQRDNAPLTSATLVPQSNGTNIHAVKLILRMKERFFVQISVFL